MPPKSSTSGLAKRTPRLVSCTSRQLTLRSECACGGRKPIAATRSPTVGSNAPSERAETSSAQARTARRSADIGCKAVNAWRLTCDSSLEGSCSDSARWTRAMAANAAAMPCSAIPDDGASIEISTSVPSQSCARRIAHRSSAMRERLLIDEQQPVHALRDVPAGKRRAGNVADVGIDPDRIAGALTGKLRAPRRQPDRVSVRLTIGENIERFDCAGGVEREAVGDQLDFADGCVNDEPADGIRAGQDAPHPRLDRE